MTWLCVHGCTLARSLLPPPSPRAHLAPPLLVYPLSSTLAFHARTVALHRNLGDNKLTGTDPAICSISSLTYCDLSPNWDWDCSMTPACLWTHICKSRVCMDSKPPSKAPTAPTKAPTKGLCIIMNSRARFFIVAASNTTYSHGQYATLYSHSRVPRSDPAYCSADDVSNQGSHKSTDERCVHRHELPRSLPRCRRIEYNVFSSTI